MSLTIALPRLRVKLAFRKPCPLLLVVVTPEAYLCPRQLRGPAENGRSTPLRSLAYSAFSCAIHRSGKNVFGLLKLAVDL